MIPPPQVPQPMHVMVPFLLADLPRMQLDFMSRHPAISEANQQAIKEWLAQYNARMVAFLRLHYGEAGVRAADAISRHAAQKLNEAATAEIKKNEDEYFAWLKATFDEE